MILDECNTIGNNQIGELAAVFNGNYAVAGRAFSDLMTDISLDR
jgi:hypothetical protein